MCASMNRSNVDFAGYSVPHPSDNLVNLRVQTVEGGNATDEFRGSLKSYSEMCARLQAAFDDRYEKEKVGAPCACVID